jgi:hypothetical protein
VLAVLEVDSGAVTRVEVASGSDPFTGAARDALLRWRFPRASRRLRIPVLVVFSAPNRFGAPGVAGQEATSHPVGGVPMPEEVVGPQYPVRGSGGAAVVLALQLDPTGAVAAATPLRSRGAFTDAALDTVRRWRFVPGSGAEEILAVCVFRAPVLPPLAR